MEGIIAILGVGAGLLTLIEPAFRPIGVGCIAAGAIVACFLGWRRGRDTHPSIAPRVDEETPADRRVE